MAKNKFSIRDFYRRHPFLSNLLMVVATGFVILWLVLLFLDYWTMHGATAVVPQVKHKSYAEAKSILMTNKLGIEISDSIYDRTLAPGTIVESWPKAGAIVKEGRQVYVTITAFSPKQVTISMPLTGNVSSRQAMSYLRGIGITDIRTRSAQRISRPRARRKIRRHAIERRFGDSNHIYRDPHDRLCHIAGHRLDVGICGR